MRGTLGQSGVLSGSNLYGCDACGCQADAYHRSALMYQHRAPTARVDVVDLDPYGTAAPFIDAAIGSIADGGTCRIILLCYWQTNYSFHKACSA